MAFPGSALKLLTVEQLQSLHDKAFENLSKQKIVTTLSFSGKNVGHQVVVNPQELMDAVVKEMRRRDPDSYGPLDDRTTATFS